MPFIPPVVSQEEVKSSCSRSPQGLGKGFKLIKGLLVLVAKEDVDGLALWCHGSAHKVSSLLLYYLVSGELQI